MEFVGLAIIVIIAYIICEDLKGIAFRLRNWYNRRRQERYNQIMERQKDRFLFYIEIHKPVPQKKKEKRQTVIYRGHFAKEAKETEDLKK
ncbi:hypothetical protein FMM68_11010 [Lachnospiraceae bacterium MD329]|nr:hypothetical protein [Lachnospiraceae bacterium MD329]